VFEIGFNRGKVIAMLRRWAMLALLIGLASPLNAATPEKATNHGPLTHLDRGLVCEGGDRRLGGFARDCDKPLADANVRVWKRDHLNAATPILDVRTDQRGRYELDSSKLPVDTALTITWEVRGYQGLAVSELTILNFERSKDDTCFVVRLPRNGRAAPAPTSVGEREDR
jgi:hypothetical protein